MASLSAYDFSTLYTSLPNNFIKDKLVNLIIFLREGSLYIACNDRLAFSPLMQLNIIIYGLVRKCVKLSPFSCSMADGVSFDISLSLNCTDLYKRGGGA